MKALVVGLGPQGRRVVFALRAIPSLELAAVVDRSDAALGWAELAPEVRRHRELAEALAPGDVDLAVITTNGPSHAALAEQAIVAGVRRIMIEKPMACSVAECERVIAGAEKAGTRLSVNQSRRHDPFYRWLREQLRAQRWGELRAVWIQRPGIGLGCLGTHYFDLVRFLADAEIRRVTAWLDPFIGPNPRGATFVDPGGLVVLELGKVRGVICQIEDGAGPMSVELDLTGARLRIDERSGAIEIVERDRSVKPGPGQRASYVTAEIPAGLSAATDVSAMTKGVLVDLVGDGPLECEARHGAASVEVLVAAYVSHERGNVPVALPLTGKQERELCLPVT